MNLIRGYENLDLLKDTIKDKFDSYMNLYYKINDEQSKKTLYYRTMYDYTKDEYYLVKLQESMYKDSPFSSNEDIEMYGYINFLLIDDNYKKIIIKNSNSIIDNSIYVITNNNLSLKKELIDKGIKENKIYVFEKDKLERRKEKYYNESFININSDINLLNDTIDNESIIKVEEKIDVELLNEVLNNYRPILMIDISINNIFDIYNCIINYLEDYDIYVRHYSYADSETIIYLIPRRF